MKWKVETEPNGFLSWSGHDVILDLDYSAKWWRYWIGGAILTFLAGWGAALVAGGLIALVAEVLGRSSGATQSLVDLLALLIPAAFLVAGVLVGRKLFKRQRPTMFFTRPWSLKGSADTLTYEAGAFNAPMEATEVSRHGSRWAILLDTIARVEIAPTMAWQQVRNYRAESASPTHLYPIPLDELQCFISAKDSSRWVFATGHADRETAEMLATSVRTWWREGAGSGK